MNQACGAPVVYVHQLGMEAWVYFAWWRVTGGREVPECAEVARPEEVCREGWRIECGAGPINVAMRTYFLTMPRRSAV